MSVKLDWISNVSALDPEPTSYAEGGVVMQNLSGGEFVIPPAYVKAFKSYMDHFAKQGIKFVTFHKEWMKPLEEAATGLMQQVESTFAEQPKPDDPLKNNPLKHQRGPSDKRRRDSHAVPTRNLRTARRGSR